jgi:diguanylate cyclase (GGDEF)-like protein
VLWVGGLLGLRAVVLAVPHALASLNSAAEAAYALGVGAPTVTAGVILADAGLLGYFAYLLRAQYLAYQQSEDRLRKRISEFAVLHEVSSAVHDLRSEDALQNIVEIVTKVLSFRRAALFLTDGVMEAIAHEYHSCRPLSELVGDQPAIRLDPQLLQEIMQRSDPVTIDGSQGTHEAERGPVLQIAVPLHGAEGPIGVLVADGSDRQDTWRWDTDMLSSLAQSAVVTIENASLHHRIKRMANRDGLTDLYNHRYFQEHLREMIAASAGRWPVSLLVVEVDRFKRYNDTFGHRQGDMALQCLARALEQCTHPWEALVARYGGDEFVIVLPRVDRQELMRLARPLREHVYDVLTTGLAKQALPPVTLSIGMATYPLDAQAAGTLIEAADRAMYVVKHDGGNWIHAYSQPVVATQGGDAELTGAGTNDRRYS